MRHSTVPSFKAVGKLISNHCWQNESMHYVVCGGKKSNRFQFLVWSKFCFAFPLCYPFPDAAKKAHQIGL